MPKITKDPVEAVTVGLRRFHREFVERVGLGENFGAKIRSILDHYAEIYDDIAGKGDSVLVYTQRDGEKIWGDKFPFEISKKDGWRAIAATAKAAGFICQVLENKELGTVEVWVSPGRKMNDCISCRKRVMEAMPYVDLS